MNWRTRRRLRRLQQEDKEMEAAWERYSRDDPHATIGDYRAFVRRWRNAR